MEEETIVVCMTVEAGDPNSWPQNIVGECNRCKVPIYWRNHMPEPSEKICMECFITYTESKSEPFHQVGVTQKTANELKSVGIEVNPKLIVNLPKDAS